MARHKKTFIKTLQNAIIVLPDLSKYRVSKLKVENVLNPPQKPIIKNEENKLLSSLFIHAYNVIPRIIQLNVFENKVAKGNRVEEKRKTNLETPKRAKLPKPPPINTANKVFILC
tara:strand:+ start:102 stop:446 length:345 start_codon:yes stop_codon:yes gene_type:complete